MLLKGLNGDQTPAVSGQLSAALQEGLEGRVCSRPVNEAPRDPVGAPDLGVEDEGPVRILTIQRPHRRNALSLELVKSMSTEMARAESDSCIGAIVISGLGEHFSAGGDAHSIVAAIDGPEGSIAALMDSFHNLVRAIWESRLPVLAAVAGVAYGGAFNLALSCDLAVCTTDARFCQVFLRRNLIPDLGGAFLLPRLVGLARAKAMMLLSPEIDAHQALYLGLVNEIVDESIDVRNRAVELGTQLASLSPTAVSLTKRLVNSSVGDFSNSLHLEGAFQELALATPAARDGFAQFL